MGYGDQTGTKLELAKFQAGSTLPTLAWQAVMGRSGSRNPMVDYEENLENRGQKGDFVITGP